VSTTGRSVIDHVKVTRTTHPGQLRFSRETRLVAGDCNSGLAISLETVGYRVYFPQNATVAPNTYNVEYYLYGATHWLQNLRDAENDAANAVCLASGCCKPRRVMERINLSPCDVQQCNSTILYDVWQINNGSLATSLSGGSCTPFVTAASTTFAPAYICTYTPRRCSHARVNSIGVDLTSVLVRWFIGTYACPE